MSKAAAQNKTQDGPNVPWAPPAPGFILLFIRTFTERGSHTSQLSSQVEDMSRNALPGFVGRRRSAKSPPEAVTDLKEERAEVSAGRPWANTISLTTAC